VNGGLHNFSKTNQTKNMQQLNSRKMQLQWWLWPPPAAHQHDGNTRMPQWTSDQPQHKRCKALGYGMQ
jgi:hypothetical protein